MITVLGMWESDWMDSERTERRLWKQTIQAFAVDHWAMCDVHGGPFSSPVQHADVATMLAAHSGPKTFLIPEGSVESSTRLRDYVHPADAVYVFGNSLNSLVPQIGPNDDVVSIVTPVGAAMFAPVVLAAVLYDRMAKAG